MCWKEIIHQNAAKPYSKKSIPFVHSLARWSGYFSLNNKKTIILAQWVETGMIHQARFTDIPLDKRFFAGGGNSVRGYKPQLAEPIAQRGEQPKGGRSIVQIGTEMRFKITEDIGAVSFIEGAQVSQHVQPSFSKKAFWGYGIGLRYYSKLGPFRFDLALPKTRRKGIDNVFEFYISLGQAF